MLQLAGSGGEKCGEELLGLVEGERKAEEVGAAGVGVFIVAGGFAGDEVREDFPGGVFPQKFLCYRILS